MEMKEKGCLNVTELQEYLGISRPTAYELVNRADFPVVRIGRRIIIPMDSLHEWMKQQVQKNQSV